jgi:hypothetical protein
VSGSASPHDVSAADTWIPSSREPPLPLNKTKAGGAQRREGEAGAGLTLSHAAHPLRREGVTGPGSREARLARWPSYPAAALEGGSGIACGKGGRGVGPKLCFRIRRVRASSRICVRMRVAGGSGSRIGLGNASGTAP